MACGTPVVTTDSMGCREYAVHEHNALVVPVGDPEAVAQAIVTLLTNSGLAEQLARNGLETARHFDFAHVVTRFEEGLTALG
jgi:glycosyltransferase involved in cell wall biosynthesis